MIRYSIIPYYDTFKYILVDSLNLYHITSYSLISYRTIFDSAIKRDRRDENISRINAH